jgi:hypothetical protein
MTISNISRNMEIVSFFQKIRNTVFLKMVDESPALISENTGFPAWSLNNYSRLQQQDLFQERSRFMNNCCHQGFMN